MWDCLELLNKIPERSIHLVVTSPPYGRYRKYSDDPRDLGNMEIFEEFDKLVEVSAKIHRCLADGRKFVLFFSDVIQKDDTGANLISPTMFLAPRILEIGFKVKNIFIWRKPGSWSNMGNSGTCPYPPSPIIQSYFEYIFVFQKSGKPDYSYVSNEVKRASLFPAKEVFRESGIFTDKPDESKKMHPALFPKSLIRRLVMLYSFVNDIVLDPFAGSGTVGVVCRELNRHFILIDLNKDYCRIMKERVERSGSLLKTLETKVSRLRFKEPPLIKREADEYAKGNE